MKSHCPIRVSGASSRARADAPPRVGDRLERFPTTRVRIDTAWVPLILAVLLAGCAHAPRLSTATRASIYERARLHFDRTVLVKPEESERPEFKLAPLLLEEVTSENDAPGVPYTVYFWQTFARANDQALDQFNYVWFDHQAGKHGRNPQGIRITFDRTGKPILWEPLRDDTGARILFVSQSLEAAAMTNYPAPLPGRRFWVERSVAEAPDTVVARIIDDGATPMGPILYLDAGSQDVSTLICRCMDAQATEVTGIGLYGLARLDDAAIRWMVRDKRPGITRWLPGKSADDLNRWLRISPR